MVIGRYLLGEEVVYECNEAHYGRMMVPCRRWMLAIIVKGNAMQFHLGQINRYFPTLGTARLHRSASSLGGSVCM